MAWLLSGSCEVRQLELNIINFELNLNCERQFELCAVLIVGELCRQPPLVMSRSILLLLMINTTDWLMMKET